MGIRQVENKFAAASYLSYYFLWVACKSDGDRDGGLSNWQKNSGQKPSIAPNWAKFHKPTNPIDRTDMLFQTGVSIIDGYVWRFLPDVLTYCLVCTKRSN